LYNKHFEYLGKCTTSLNVSDEGLSKALSTPGTQLNVVSDRIVKHNPKAINSEKTLFVEQIKNKIIENPNSPLQKLYNRTLQDFTKNDHDCEDLLDFSQLKESLYDYRKEVLGNIVLPKNLSEVTITEEKSVYSMITKKITES
jgi:hypothetical protein